MKLHAYLSKSRHGIFYFRWPLPQTTTTAPRSTVRFSLFTRCPKEAGTLARHLAVCGEALTHLMVKSSMNRAELRAKAHAYFQAQLKAGIERRSTLGPFTDEEKCEAAQTIELYESSNKDLWHLLGRDNAQADLDEFCAAAGIPLEENRSHFPVILDEIRKAKLGTFKAILEYGRSLESYDFTEPQAAPQSAVDPELRQSTATASDAPQRGSLAVSGPLLSVLFAERKAEAEKSGEWSPKLLDDYQSWTDMFIELIGDRSILEYNKAHARQFKDILTQLPSNRSKHAQTKGLSPLEAIEAAKAHSLDRLSTSTVNKALGRMQATWKWVDKQLDDEVADIFGPMKLAKRGNARTEADPFSKAQLQAIFTSPLFTGCKSERFRAEPGETDMSGTSWYWLPLLGLWTGARLNELCQLRVADVDDDDGIPFLRLHEGDETQRVKGRKARNVPIHPQLTKLGFLHYVQAQRRAGNERVFPTLSVGTAGYYSDRPSKDFSNYIKQIGIKTDKTSFHSFRHNFKDACRHAGVNADINDILLGHALPGMAGRYGTGGAPLALLHAAVSKIEHPGMLMQHVKGYP